MFIFRNVFFNKNINLISNLIKLKGIGFQRALNLCLTLGLNSNLKVLFLNKYKFNLLVFLIKKYYGIDNILLQIRQNRKKDFLSVKSYKMIKFTFGLPINGQSTRTNRKTAKKMNLIKN